MEDILKMVPEGARVKSREVLGKSPFGGRITAQIETCAPYRGKSQVRVLIMVGENLWYTTRCRSDEQARSIVIPQALQDMQDSLGSYVAADAA